jgi:hypothetical protein
MKRFRELTIDELMEDGLTRTIMLADGVDASALKGMFHVLAISIKHRSEQFLPNDENSSRSYIAPTWRGSWKDIFPKASNAPERHEMVEPSVGAVADRVIVPIRAGVGNPDKVNELSCAP